MADDKSGGKPVRWGVLGASHFALMAAIPGMKKAPLVDVQAVASRSLDKAKQFAASAGVPRALGSYEELVADPEIEAIYNPLPNNMHVPWSIKAAQAGKHVLCEKPLSMNAAEAEELAKVQKQTGKIIAEAFMVRYHPQWDKVVELIASGRIGKARAIQTAFSYSNSDLDNIRNQKEVGGGALYDIGGYAINTARLIFGTEPQRAVGMCDWDPESKCDRLTSAILDFGVGQATFVVGTQHVPYQRVHVYGSKGHIEVEIPFNAPYDRPCKVYVDEGFVGAPDFTVAQSSDDRRETLSIAAANQYTVQGQRFSEAIRGGKPVHNDMPSAIANMRVIDAIFRSAESQRWEDV
ncbi:MAG TPA: Gfo/Idh/MocA family oxidoreductase [Polyangiaceae bacterium]|nr:Gfo/Idh/MocA family oxidoreductase [Polyangiaceae bacterium]